MYTLYFDNKYARIYFILDCRCVFKVYTSAKYHLQDLIMNQQTLYKVSIEPCMYTPTMVVFVGIQTIVW